MINEINLQQFLFKKDISRIDLLNYVPLSKKHKKIAIYRNHSFEMIEHTIALYLDYAGISAEFVYSDYDDGLSFFNLDTTADLLILWIDFTRYQNQNINDFIIQRVNYLKTIFKNPILFVPFEGDLNIQDCQIYTYDLSYLGASLGNKYKDERLEKYSGTKLSPDALLFLSKDLGLRYIPAMLKPSLKAVIVDLDNTLYEGILGEDGIDRLILTEGHIKLQKTLKKLAQEGFFLCVVSKNEEKDVIKLFEERKDFPLQLNDFTKVLANWKTKAENTAEIIKYLNIGADSIVFVDDNIGELLNVKNVFPSMNVILALKDAEITNQIINNYPGLLRLNIKHEDTIRKKDIQANEQRELLQQQLSKEEYLKNLQIELSYHINDMSHVLRLSELSNKTNQFIFNYKRYQVSELERLIKDDASCVVDVSLKDRLSDSGIIGVVVLTKNDKGATLEECFVSCRALGRGIDEDIVLGAIQIGLDSLDIDTLKIEFKHGDRNTPALNFIHNNLSNYVEKYSKFKFQLKDNCVKTNIVKGK